VRLYPAKSTNSKEAMEALSDYFRAYSRPTTIVSDRGTCFTSDMFEEFLESRKIKHVKIATGSPQANGQDERINRDLGLMISKLVDVEKNVQCHKVLEEVESATNNTKHRSINEHLSIMLFGVNQKGKMLDCLEENVLESRLKRKEINLEKIRKNAEASQEKVQNYNKKYVDAK